MRERVRLNRVRVIIRAPDRGAVKVSSTFDKTVELGTREDADFSWPDSDVLVIRNTRAAPAKVTLRNYEPSDMASRLIIQPSRQSLRTLSPSSARGLVQRVLGRGYTESEVTLGAEESCILRTDAWLAHNRRNHDPRAYGFGR